MLEDLKGVYQLKDLKPELILELQKSLTKLKYNVGKIDGIYGNDTLYAFNRFKEDFALSEPNLIGPTTIKLLRAALNDEIDRDEEGDNQPHEKQPAFERANEVPTKINWLDFNCPISKYFTVGEVSKFSKERIVHNALHRINAIKLAKLLDSVREEWGKPLGVTSWYRPSPVNNRVNGARNSQHLTASGVDIYPINGNGLEFEKWLDKRWLRALGYGQRSGRNFTHCDLRQSATPIRWNY